MIGLFAGVVMAAIFIGAVFLKDHEERLEKLEEKMKEPPVEVKGEK